MDKGVVEKFGPYGLEIKLADISRSINNLSTGIVTNYALYILSGLIFVIQFAYYSEHSYMDEILILILLILICLTKPSKNIS